MFIRMKTLAAAVVAAGSLVANHAFAIAITDTPTLELWLAGSSAQDPLLAALVPTLCDDAPITFTDTAGQAGVSHSAYFCTMSSAKIAGFSGPQKVLIHKRSTGGSIFGVAPVARSGIAGQTLATAGVTQMEISFTTGGTVVGNNCKLDSGSRYVCNPANTVNRIVDAGISDVEPALFIGPNLVPVGPDYGTVSGSPGTAALTNAELLKLKTNTMSATTYGIVVTKDLRNALQKAQGKTIGSDAVADMPSMTSAQIRTIFAAGVGDWSQFNVFDAASNLWRPLTELATSTLATTTINVCRGNPGSGTQAVFNAQIMGQPCGGSNPLAYPDTTISSRHVAYLPTGAAQGQTSVDAFEAAINDSGPGIPTVNETATSGDLTACMRDLENGRASVAVGKAWGIGFQPILAADPSFRFIAIDGVTPTWNNVAASNYTFWGVSSVVYLQSADSGALATALAGNKKLIADKLVALGSDPAQLNTLVNKANANIVGPTKLGMMALSTKGFMPSTPYSPTNPVLPVTRQGISGDMTYSTCRQPNVDGAHGPNLEMIAPSPN